MRQLTYLNGILTLNAVLLTGVLWTQVAGTPVLAQAADAQVVGADAAGIPGIPNAGSQRERMIQLLEQLGGKLDAMSTSLQSGKTRVEVSNLDEIKLEMPAQE